MVTNAQHVTRSQREAQGKAFAELLDRAYAAADRAQAGLVEDMRAFDCGFAWVTVEPGNHEFVRFCRKMATAGDPLGKSYAEHKRYGSKGYPRGWQFWCPGPFNGQALAIHEAGARAFRDVLALAEGMGGARVSIGSRYD